MDQEGCAEIIMSGFNDNQCSRRGKLHHKGKKYCKQHYPPYVKQRNVERQKRWEKEWADDSKKSHVKAAAPDLLAALKEVYKGYMQDPGTIFDWDAWAKKAKQAIAKAEKD